MEVVVLDVNTRFARLGYASLIVLVRDGKRLAFVNVPYAVGKTIAESLLGGGAASRPVYEVGSLEVFSGSGARVKGYVRLGSSEFAGDLLKACEKVLGGGGVLVKIGRCVVGENGRLSFKDNVNVALPYSAGVRLALEKGYVKYGEEVVGVYVNLYGIEGAAVLRAEDGEPLLRKFISGVG